MAVFASTISFNHDEFDFYDLVEYFYAQGFQDDFNGTAEYTINGYTFEAFVKDSFYSQFQIDEDIYSTAFISETDITIIYNDTDIISVSGTINTIGTVDLETGSPLYGITGINVDFADLAEIILTPTSSDDLSIIRDMLIGDDTFYLSDQSDLARGFNGNDIMYGYFGDDKLYGGAGNDKSYGQGGADRLYMDAGNDTLNGGTGTDWLYVTGSTNSVVNLAKTTAQNTGYGTDIIKNIENASGGKGVDKFYGTGGNNTLKGNNGNDVLSGKNGNDKLYGGNNNDKLYGGNNNDKLYGGNNNDKLYGGNGNDLLKGSAGRDILQGDAGKDTMFGGSGADTFVFKKTSDSKVNASKADVIKDFQQGQDHIDLHFIDASTKISGNNAFTFDGTKSFGTSKQGDVYYEKFNNAGTANDYTMVYIDTDNDRGTEMSIKLMGLHNLTAEDFIL
jgi:Ca2+-binding RTX toxin-like protein